MLAKKQSDNTKTPPKRFDYTAFADRLRAVSLNNDSHSTGVVKTIYRITTLPLIIRTIPPIPSHKIAFGQSLETVILIVNNESVRAIFPLPITSECIATVTKDSDVVLCLILLNCILM